MLVAALEFPLRTGDRVTATLALADIATIVEGIIVRTVGDGRVVLRFPETDGDDASDLCRIHRALEQAWLEARKPKSRR